MRHFRPQLLKWIGNKQRFAPDILATAPSDFRTYREPFLGSGGVLATLAPERAVASDAYPPLIEIFRALQDSADDVTEWYASRLREMEAHGKEKAYERVRARFNASPNGPDLLFLSRACYGGVIRFRKSDGAMSTRCGPHTALPTLPKPDHAGA